MINASRHGQLALRDLIGLHLVAEIVQRGLCGHKILKRRDLYDAIKAKIKLPIGQRSAEGTSFTARLTEGQIEIHVSNAGQFPALAATA